ncbi:multiple inositol polyphosphate phosphatase 1-like [Contarinia nasturtii]|uniref:multiple inositol polyphosphate phosphatase 1-like n=1 Tax=Contarinia nasturtii TaxID=265458 RepID=UPI0012D45D9F|nr:multiple inositol polyphosphate phosphatase 1-like [Contarinia nasturtii]
MNFSILFIFITAFIVKGEKKDGYCHQYCYSFDYVRSQTSFFSTKTPYFTMRRKEIGKQFQVANCDPVKIWLYIRHGARLPKAKEMDRLSQLENLRTEIIANYKKSNSTIAFGAMCEADLDLLREWQWNWNITKEYDEHLTTQGWNDIKLIAARYRQFLPNIFEDNYNKQKYLFRYTDVQRTEASFKAFVEGLFGSNAHQYINVPPQSENVKLLKPYKFCASNEEKITGNQSEYRKYLRSNIMTQLAIDVSERLGFGCPLKITQILDVYDMCIYEHAWNPKATSAWCSAFTPSQIHELEYIEELRKYYESGYGIKTNERLVCSLVNDMLNHIGNNDEPKAVVYVTHSSSLLLLLTALKAFSDADSLRASNYYSMSTRKWRLSNIAPLAANFAAVKYNCPNDIEQEKVRFFLNEDLIEFDWCDKGLCNWSDVKKEYDDYIQASCDEYYCSSSNTRESQSGYMFSIALLILAFISCLFVSFSV